MSIIFSTQFPTSYRSLKYSTFRTMNDQDFFRHFLRFLLMLKKNFNKRYNLQTPLCLLASIQVSIVIITLPYIRMYRHVQQITTAANIPKSRRGYCNKIENVDTTPIHMYARKVRSWPRMEKRIRNIIL
jgi:hypothetical protein